MSEKGYKKLTLDIASPNPPKARILLIYTGGTIGMGASESGKLVPYDFKKMLKHIPEINTYDLQITFISLTQPIDSSDIDPIHWNHIIEIISNYEGDHDGIVILHGTDTMEHTAKFCLENIKNLNHPVVFTGAMKPLGFDDSDAQQNFTEALYAAAVVASGVYISFHGKLFKVPNVRKNKALGTFETYDL